MSFPWHHCSPELPSVRCRSGRTSSEKLMRPTRRSGYISSRSVSPRCSKPSAAVWYTLTHMLLFFASFTLASLLLLRGPFPCSAAGLWTYSPLRSVVWPCLYFPVSASVSASQPSSWAVEPLQSTPLPHLLLADTLKLYLKFHNLKVTGNKGDLISRIQDHNNGLDTGL